MRVTMLGGPFDGEGFEVREGVAILNVAQAWGTGWVSCQVVRDVVMWPDDAVWPDPVLPKVTAKRGGIKYPMAWIVEWRNAVAAADWSEVDAWLKEGE